ncbi:hypothetical protein BJ165DRAFT_1476527 [Panaeolus papilionaceus]|nr:hypothetical protein BJ165DRAFT_1476527 [Panaeolus papilionaceus]
MSSHTAHSPSERPERSRNAKAQARHRAKRKAYIDQLEQTVTKLQIAVGYTTEQINALPPPLLKIRELEQDNARLQKENDDLRRLLTSGPSESSRSLSSDRRSSGLSMGYPDPRDRDYKRRKGHQDGVYISPGDTPPHGVDSGRPPPPLTIPPSMSHYHYGSNSTGHGNGHGPSFNLHAPNTFQMPNTPSGSSATSSPPFSPTQMQGPPLDHHRPHPSDHMSSYPPSSHYTSVKVEDDNYGSGSHASHPPSMQYSYSGSQSQGHSSMDWHSPYSSERAHLHR